jgi:membrane protease YdiL (CAAX protease family)
VGWSQLHITNWLDNSVTGQFALIVLVEALTLLLLWAFLKRRRASFRDLGLKRPRLTDIGYALAGFAAYFVVYIGVLTAAQQLVPSLNINQDQQLGFNTSTTGPALIYIFISLVLLPPIVEEIMTRGFLYTGLRSKLPKIIAALITSVIFASAHLQWGSGAPLLWVAALDTFTLSMVLVYLREKTDSLAAPMGVHMIKNGLAFVVLFNITHYLR